MYTYFGDKLSDDIFLVTDSLQYVSFYFRIASSFLTKKGGRYQIITGHSHSVLNS